MPTRRSIILAGQTTSISMEDELWRELDRQAEANDLKWQEYAREALAECPPHANRSSFVRELLVRNLRAELDFSAGSKSVPASTWVINSKGGAKRYDFRKSHIVAGRGSDCDICINDPLISKRHLLLAFDGLYWWAVDLDSKNGTWSASRHRFDKGRFTHGDKLRFGTAELINIS